MTVSGVRPCLAIAGSVLTFALLIEHAGLIPAVVGAVVIASRGSTTIPVRKAVLLSLWLAAAMSLLFVGFLDQAFPLVAGF
jgi:hypothetical protein